MNQKRDHDAGSSLDPTGAAPSFRAEEKQAKARQVSSRMRWLLGTDWKQRLRIKRFLGASAVYGLMILLLMLILSQDYLSPDLVTVLVLTAGATNLVFYALLRTDRHLRFRDPSLTMPQMMAAITFCAWIYLMGGAVRDLILLILTPLLVFGFRFLRTLQVRVLSAYTMLVLALAMMTLLLTQPDTYDMGSELLRFMLVAVICVTMIQFRGSDTEETTGGLHRLMRLVFTDDPRQRLRIQRSLMAAVNFVIGTAVVSYAVSQGAVNATAGTALGVYMVGNSVVFYLLLRSGWSLRLQDPSMTLPQIMVAITCVVAAYTILGDSRGVTLMLLVLVLAFGLFNLTATQARLAAFFALLLQGLAMLAMVKLAPDRYPARQEMIHFLFACTTLPTISLLAGQLSDLRARLQARKEELSVAVERIQTLATRDELTGLFNRRHMSELLQLQKKFSDRGGRVFCIAILDIDHFKLINDGHGHGVGDEVLRNFSQAVQHELRDSDVIARWGGEEFLLMLTECRVGHAESMVERVRCEIERMQLSQQQPGLRATFSAGLAEQRFDESIEATIERADQALYRAKHGGRNRTVQAV